MTAKHDAGLAAALLTGLSAREAVTVFRAVESLVIGSARASTENATLTRETGVTIAEWWTGQGEAGIFGPIKQGDFPALAAVLDAGGFDQSADADDPTQGYAAEFEEVLNLLLDGIATRLK